MRIPQKVAVPRKGGHWLAGRNAAALTLQHTLALKGTEINSSASSHWNWPPTDAGEAKVEILDSFSRFPGSCNFLIGKVELVQAR